ncbi:UNVERIFIED_CONTAM: Pentatricopeptide repeat-containing protein, mitochondrial [Sesamum latifolium]|uniref:Pentatricopeptide repeat-containing protein, mitochondrial n=1 Tax=Sesamum latifolium TaxID=2727402 RepID=A0AAW2U0P5_9LAMI
MGDPSLGYTLDEALSTVGFGAFQGLALVFAGISWFSEAMEMNLLSFIGPAVKSEWSLSPTEESLLSTAVFGGMLVGALFWGFVSDAYGRRIGMQSIVVVIAGGGLLSAFSPDYKSLVLLRCILGFGVAGGHVFASWFLEFVPSSNRGAWTLSILVFWILGELFEASLAWIIMPSLGWRWLLGLSALPALLVVIFSVFVPESPRYLFAEGRINEAFDILKKVALMNRKKLPAGILVSDQTKHLDEENSPSTETPLLSLARKKTNGLQTSAKNLFELFSSDLLRTTLLMLLLHFGFTFAFYGVVLMISAVSSEPNDCRSLTILLRNGHNTSLYRNVLITSSAEIPGLIIATVFVERVGRKLTMGILTILAFILILPLSFHQNEVVTTALLFCARMLLFAAFSTLTMYAKEVYPTSIRATGSGLATSVGRIGGMICPLVAVGLVCKWLNRRGTYSIDSTNLKAGIAISLVLLCVRMGDSDTVYTLDEALTTVGFGKYHGLLLAYGGLGGLLSYGDDDSSRIGSQTEWHLSSGQKSLISTVVFAGMLVGAYFWGVVSDNYGRKTNEANNILRKAALLNGTALPAGKLVSDQEQDQTNEHTASESTQLLSPRVDEPYNCKANSSSLGSWPDLISLHRGQSGSEVFHGNHVCVSFIATSSTVGHQNAILTTTLLFGARTFVSATFVVACIYCPEVYPTNIRATGVGIATAIGRIGGMICPLVAVGLVNDCRQAYAVVLFQVMIILSALSVLLSPFETKGRNLADTLTANDRAITFLNSDVKRLVSQGLYEQALAFYVQYVHPFQLHTETAFVVPSIAKACALSQSQQILGLQIHCNVIKNGFEEFTISNSLLSMYAKFWDTKSALKLFDEMPSRDTISWNSMINCYTQNGCLLEALKMFRDMYAHGFVPKPEIVASCLSTCVKCGNWGLGRAIHALVFLDERMEYSSFVATALVDFYWKFDDPNMASRVFDRIVEKNEVSWTAMISGCIEYHDHVRAFACLLAMQCEGVKPNRVTLISVLPACGELRSVKRGKEIHAYAVRHGYDLDAQFSSALLHMYCECGGALQIARLIFDRSVKKEVVMWSSMIAGYSRSKDCAREAMRLFNEMQMEGILPNNVTILAMISACTNLISLIDGCGVHGYSLKLGFGTDLYIQNALIDMYSKCGSLGDSVQVFNEMMTRDCISWSALISAYGLYGYTEEALQLFDEMQGSALKADRLLYLAVLSTCNHAGLVEEGQELFDRALKDINVSLT